VGDHEPRRDAACHQRADHRAGRGAHDVVGAARVPAGLAGERAEAAHEPCPAEHAPGAQYKSDPHA
jgi:hypothetical protein